MATSPPLVRGKIKSSPSQNCLMCSPNKFVRQFIIPLQEMQAEVSLIQKMALEKLDTERNDWRILLLTLVHFL